MKKFLWVLLALAVMAVAVIMLKVPRAAAPVAPTVAAPAPMMAVPSAGLLLASDIAWTYKAGKQDGANPPQAAVTVTVQGHPYEVGSYNGSCSPVMTLLPKEISAIQCYYAGGGTELGIFSEQGKIVLKKGDIDEGSAETAPFRGNFHTVQEISVQR